MPKKTHKYREKSRNTNWKLPRRESYLEKNIRIQSNKHKRYKLRNMKNTNCCAWIPFIKWKVQLQHHSNINKDKIGKYIFTNDHNSIKALPTLEDLLACHARSKACLSCRRLSSRWRAACRRCAAALAPGPSWLSLSSRQSELARTIVTLIALLISPTTLPSWPGPASQPWALLIAATLDSAKISRSLCRSGERSPQGPATSCPPSRPPRLLNLVTKGPGCGSGSPARRWVAPWNLTS